ncbi:MAG: TolB family protein [Phototrophicaceae bacterium]|jgi:hypothetical protein
MHATKIKSKSSSHIWKWSRILGRGVAAAFGVFCVLLPFLSYIDNQFRRQRELNESLEIAPLCSTLADLSQMRLAYVFVHRYNRSSTTYLPRDIMLSTLDGKTSCHLTLDYAQEDNVVWSHDGSQLAYTIEGNVGNDQIAVFDLVSRETRKITVQDTHRIRGMDWNSRSGEFAIQLIEGNGSYIADMEGHTIRYIDSELELSLVGSPKWQPSGDNLLFEGYRSSEGLFNRIPVLFNLQTNTLRFIEIPITLDGLDHMIWLPNGEQFILVSYPSNRSTSIWIVNLDGSYEKLIDYDRQFDVQQVTEDHLLLYHYDNQLHISSIFFYDLSRRLKLDALVELDFPVNLITPIPVVRPQQ